MDWEQVPWPWVVAGGIVLCLLVLLIICLGLARRIRVRGQRQAKATRRKQEDKHSTVQQPVQAAPYAPYFQSLGYHQIAPGVVGMQNTISIPAIQQGSETTGAVMQGMLPTTQMQPVQPVMVAQETQPRQQVMMMSPAQQQPVQQQPIAMAQPLQQVTMMPQAQQPVAMAPPVQQQPVAMVSPVHQQPTMVPPVQQQQVTMVPPAQPVTMAPPTRPVTVAPAMQQQATMLLPIQQAPPVEPVAVVTTKKVKGKFAWPKKVQSAEKARTQDIPVRPLKPIQQTYVPVDPPKPAKVKKQPMLLAHKNAQKSVDALQLLLEGPMGLMRVQIPVEKSFSFGREADRVDVVIKDPAVSRVHFYIMRVNENVMVIDANSDTGTYVNDVLMTSPYTLKPGDLVRAGDSTLRVEQV